jgi:hypothetical protein
VTRAEGKVAHDNANLRTGFGTLLSRPEDDPVRVNAGFHLVYSYTSRRARMSAEASAELLFDFVLWALKLTGAVLGAFLMWLGDLLA